IYTAYYLKFYYELLNTMAGTSLHSHSVQTDELLSFVTVPNYEIGMQVTDSSKEFYYRLDVEKCFRHQLSSPLRRLSGWWVCRSIYWHEKLHAVEFQLPQACCFKNDFSAMLG
uniref:Uncharacterized protein n=1 Tax=Parascaris univalens TaxID=6257 RepID=A0A914ZU54_PARUN